MESGVNLPEDALVEILLRLPVKSLLRFLSVCRSWCDLLKTQRFIDMHLNLNITKDDQQILLIKRFNRNECKAKLSFHSKSDEDELLSLGLPDLDAPSLDPSFINPELSGCCNGLVCIHNSYQIMVCNPSLREFRKLPDPSFRCPKRFFINTEGVGFWYDSVSHDFKVVRIFSINPRKYRGYVPCNAEIYNLNTNSWRKMDVVLPMIVNVPRSTLLFNESFHWIAGPEYGEERILSFHFSAEIFQEIQYPEETGERVPSLAVLGESLAFIVYTVADIGVSQHFDIWVMKEYDVKESWTRLFSIGPLSGIHCPLSFWRNNQLFLQTTEGQLVSCALLHGQQIFQKYDVYSHPESLELVNYEESLISVNRNNHR